MGVGNYSPWAATLPSAGAAVGSAARSASAPTHRGRRGAGHIVAAARLQLAYLGCSAALRNGRRNGRNVGRRMVFVAHSNRSRIVLCNMLCRRPPQYAPAPATCKLTFDRLILKVVSESRVTWATSVPILVFLRASVLDLGPMYTRQTYVKRSGVNPNIF